MKVTALTSPKAAKFFLGVVTLLLPQLLSVMLFAQVAKATLPEAPIPTVESAASQQTGEIPDAIGCVPGAASGINFALNAGGIQEGPQSQNAKPVPPEPTPQSSSGSSGPPSLADLGLTPAQVQGSAQAQARLDRRTHMLKIHQRLGLLTMIPMAATVISSAGATAGRRNTSNTGNTAGRDLHAALGSVTIGMYAATAYYAIRAPRMEGVQSRGAIRMHKALVWIHGPGIILTPILGAMAFKQENAGEKVHGIASAHAAVAWVTVGAYAASIVAVSWPIRLKFWEKP